MNKRAVTENNRDMGSILKIVNVFVLEKIIIIQGKTNKSSVASNRNEIDNATNTDIRKKLVNVLYLINVIRKYKEKLKANKYNVSLFTCVNASRNFRLNKANRAIESDINKL